MKKYHVQVTQQDIETGESQDCEFCPVALAVRRAANRDVIVGVAHVRLAEEEGGDGVPLPDVARQFIYDFDRSLPVFPFEFDIDLPF